MQIVNPTPSAMYTGIANAVSQISSTEGARSLWRGIASVALGAGTFGLAEKCADGDTDGELFQIQVRHMRYTLAPMNLSRNLLVVMWEQSITQSQ